MQTFEAGDEEDESQGYAAPFRGDWTRMKDGDEPPDRGQWMSLEEVMSMMASNGQAEGQCAEDDGTGGGEKGRRGEGGAGGRRKVTIRKKDAKKKGEQEEGVGCVKDGVLAKLWQDQDNFDAEEWPSVDTSGRITGQGLTMVEDLVVDLIAEAGGDDGMLVCQLCEYWTDKHPRRRLFQRL
jgi:hypothetical protein